MFVLASMLLAAPIAVHANLPAELETELRVAIERQTGVKPDLTRHSAIEGEGNALECSRLVREVSGAPVVLVVHYDAVRSRIHAQLFDRPGSNARSIVIEVAKGSTQAANISINALARAAFPKLEPSLPEAIGSETPSVKRKPKRQPTAELSQPGTFELTVELDGEPVKN